MKTATKKTPKTAKTAPSPETSPRFKKLVRAGMIGPDTTSHLGDADAIEASKAHYTALGAAQTAPEAAPAAEADATPATAQERPEGAGDATPRELAEEGFVSREPASPPAWFPTEAIAAQPFRTIQDLGATWIAYLRANGATESTATGYGRDLAIAYKVLGSDTPPGLIGPEAVASFEASDRATKKRDGKPRAKPSILRTHRVLRLAFTWAVSTGRATFSPYTKAVVA